MGIPGRNTLKPINKTDPAVSGFFTSNAEIVRIEMGILQDSRKILYYAGKALGDTSLVMSITKNLGDIPNGMLTEPLRYMYPPGEGADEPTALQKHIVKTHDILEAVTAAVKDEAFILENTKVGPGGGVGYIFIPGNDDDVPADPAVAAAQPAARLLAAEKLRLTEMLTEQREKIRTSYQSVIEKFRSTLGRTIYTNSADSSQIPVNPRLIQLIIGALSVLQTKYLEAYTRVLESISAPGSAIPPGVDVTTLSAKFKGILACKNQVLDRPGGYYFNSRIIISKNPAFAFTLDRNVLETPTSYIGSTVFSNFLNNIYTLASIAGYLENPPSVLALVELGITFDLLADAQPLVDPNPLATVFTIPPMDVAAQSDEDAISSFNRIIFTANPQEEGIKATVREALLKIDAANREHDLTPVINKLSKVSKIKNKYDDQISNINQLTDMEKSVERLEARKKRYGGKIAPVDAAKLAQLYLDIKRLKKNGLGITDTSIKITKSAPSLKFKAMTQANESFAKIKNITPGNAVFQAPAVGAELPIVREKPGCFPYFQKCLEYVGTSAKKLIVMIGRAMLTSQLSTDPVILNHLYEEISTDDFNGVQTGGAMAARTGPMPWELAMINAFCCDFNANQFANLGYINGINAPPVVNYDSIIVKSFQKERDMYLAAIGMKMNAEGTSVEPLPASATPASASAPATSATPAPAPATPAPATNEPPPATTIVPEDSGIVYGKPKVRVSNEIQEDPTPQTVLGGQRVEEANPTIDLMKSGVRLGGSPNVEDT
jgi:hypothetical protein